MAPEQASNGAVDHRTDLFSLGSVLYAMGTGHSPFQGNSVVGVIRKVCDEHPKPVHEINPALPRWFSDIVARLMAKAPAERFQSAQEVGELLERYLARVQRGDCGGLPGAKRRSTADPRVARRTVLAAAVSVVLLGLCMFLLKAPHGSTTVGGTTNSPAPASSPAPFLALTETGGNVGAFTNIADALSAIPSGGVVEFCWNGPREMPPVTLPPKPLTLRAAKGFRPGWIHTNVSVAAFSASGALTMEDMELSLDAELIGLPGRPRPRQRTTRSGVGLIVISNAPLRLSRCVLQLPDPRVQGRGAPLGADGLTAIILDNVATCELQDSALLADRWTAVLWRHAADESATLAAEGRERRLSLSNCIVTAFWAVSILSSEDSRKRLQLVRNTFRGVHLIDIPPTPAAGAISVLARSNLFSTATIVVDGRTTNREVFTASMQWQGGDNLFSLSSRGGGRPGGYIVLRNTSGPATLAQWNQWWPQPETDSREVSVAFADATDAPATGSSVDFARAAYKFTNVNVTEGPPLHRDQWERFGADTANIGPRSDP